MVVRSSFELEPPLKANVTRAVHTLTGASVPVAYETDPGMDFGIELTAGDLRLTWGVGTYMDALEKSVSELLDEQAAPKRGADATEGKAREPEN